MEEQTDLSHKELKHLLKRNADLVEENNKLLRKIHRNGLVGVWVRISWYALLVVSPFILYFFFQSYFASLQSFSEHVQEIPSVMKQFNEAVQTYYQNKQ